MDKLKSMLATFEVLLAVLECIPESGCAESTIYLGLGSNYDAAMKVLSVLQRSEGISIKGHWVSRGPKYNDNITKANTFIAQVKTAMTGL